MHLNVRCQLWCDGLGTHLKLNHHSTQVHTHTHVRLQLVSVTLSGVFAFLLAIPTRCFAT